MRSAFSLMVLAATVAVGLSGQVCLALSESESMTVSGEVVEYQTITPVHTDLQLEPALELDPETGKSYTDMSNNTDLLVSSNTTLTVGVSTVRQISLISQVDGTKSLPCRVTLTANGVPTGHWTRRTVEPIETGTQTVYLKGFSGASCYGINVAFRVDEATWTVSTTHGDYRGTATLTVGPAYWPGTVPPSR